MDKVENLDNLQFLVTELVGSIRQNIIEDNMIKNENINKLDKHVNKFILEKPRDLWGGTCRPFDWKSFIGSRYRVGSDLVSNKAYMV